MSVRANFFSSLVSLFNFFVFLLKYSICKLLTLFIPLIQSFSINYINFTNTSQKVHSNPHYSMLH